MRVYDKTPESNSKQAASNDLSIRKDHSKPADGLYARQRRLERQLAIMETTLSTIRRDLYRIEKAHQRSKALTDKPNIPGLPDDIAGLFMGRSV